MRIYPTNEKGEKKIILECTNIMCKYSFDSVMTVIWQKENYNYDRCCHKCGSALDETMQNWEPMPTSNF